MFIARQVFQDVVDHEKTFLVETMSLVGDIEHGHWCIYDRIPEVVINHEQHCGVTNEELEGKPDELFGLRHLVVIRM